MSTTPTVSVPEEAGADLALRLRGRLVGPEDPDYDQARAVWNGMIDKRPALIAQCRGAADVRAAVAFGREHGLPIVVRGGGHNVAGDAVCDGGLVVDLSSMRSVRVDAQAQTVRAEGGVTIGDLDLETQAFGLAVPMGVVTETGISGLTLGGGLGWIRRMYGLSCDALLSADVVTASGEVVTASDTENPDLFWALKGAGGNFGVVTSLEYRAFPVGPEVFFAFVVHAGTDARTALQDYREWAASAPDEISAFAILWHGPEIDEIPAEHHGKPIVVYLAMHCGTPVEGEAALQPLRDLGKPVVDLSDTMPYLDVQKFFDADYPAHVMRYYWKSRYLPTLDDDAIDRMVSLNEATPSHHSTIDLWQLGGAMSRIAPHDTALGDRSAGFLVGIESNWEEASDDAAAVAWGREVYAALEPYASAGEYLNFPGTNETPEGSVRGTFGANLERLVAVKRQYDPDNVFRPGSNINPAW